MNKKADKFEKKFLESRLQYIKALPGKISEINLIWNQLNTTEWRLEVLLKMRNLVHTLSGSGSTFGFHELSEQAQELEQALAIIRPLFPEDSAYVIRIQGKLKSARDN